MKIIPFVLLLLFILGAIFRLNGQSAPYVQGQILVQLNDQLTGSNRLNWLQNLTIENGFSTPKPISTHLNIWLFEIPGSGREEHYWIDFFHRKPEVLNAQLNHVLEQRFWPPNILPNDSLFYKQWQHLNTGAGGSTPDADLDSELAWEITTGGLSPLGDSIVVAVIDGGIDTNHEDLKANFWYNRQEIPGDNFDNDNNGYIDDFKGWNVYSNTDDISGLSPTHGTPVSAIIAAKGNNGIGVSGINWDVQLMFVAGNSTESAILQAYDYVLNSRKLYNSTNGQQGAFIVAVNCSWGITYGQPANAPLWCAAFDSLGAAGILSVAATANTALNVDEVGDLPTACPSDFLISVTNLNKWDQKPNNAAWGPTTIDLGAYGKDVFTAGAGNSYGYFSGTSFAAPQVSGAIGLLYAAPCNNLALLAKTQPAEAAMLAKKLLLESTTPNADLANSTVSGGRLNLNNLVQDYEDQCATCLPPLAVAADSISENTLLLHWSEVSQVQRVSLRWRKKDAPVWSLVSDISSPFKLADLQRCTSYEFSLRSGCEANDWSVWTPPMTAKTLGCCAPPGFISVSNTTDSTATVSWSNFPAAPFYQVLLQAAGSPGQVFQTSTNSLKLNTLSPCTFYQITLQSICGKDDSISLPVYYTFNTSGCGACTDKTYCVAGASVAANEWIAGITLGNWEYNSGGGPGYVDYTATPLDLPEILANSSLPVTIKPGYSSASYKEFFRVYIDFNADGDFTDPGEMAFDPGFASDMPVTGWIYTPANMAWGPTRMRVMMKFKDLQSNPPSSCESFSFGQVEDYCVHLGPKVNAETSKDSVLPLMIYPQPASDQVRIRWPKPMEESGSLSVLNLDLQVVFQQTVLPVQQELVLPLANVASGVYLVRLQSGSTFFYRKLLVLH